MRKPKIMLKKLKIKLSLISRTLRRDQVSAGKTTLNCKRQLLLKILACLILTSRATELRTKRTKVRLTLIRLLWIKPIRLITTSLIRLLQSLIIGTSTKVRAQKLAGKSLTN